MSPLRATIGLVVTLLLGLGFWVLARRGEPLEGPGDPADASGAELVGEGAAGSQARLPSGPESDEAGLLFGHLRDTDGHPFAELRVTVLRGSTRLEARTDAAGRFEFTDLAPGSLRLDLSASFDPAEPLGKRVLAAAVAPLELEMPASERFDAGVHVLPRSHPFWFEGYVVIEPGWAQREGIGLNEVRIEVQEPGPDDVMGFARARRPQEPGASQDWNFPPWLEELPPRPELAPDGTFRFAVETPHDPFLVVARVRRLEPCEKLVVPKPEGLVSETFLVPPP